MDILNIIIILLVISWIGGFSLQVGGGFVHLLLLFALVIFVVRLLGV
jgi:hypothetical protein